MLKILHLDLLCSFTKILKKAFKYLFEKNLIRHFNMRSLFLLYEKGTHCHDNAVLMNEYIRYFLKFILFYLFLAALGLCCCAWVFSSCSECELLFVVVRGLLIAVASRCRARALGVRASAVVARGLSSCGLQTLERRLSSCGAQA